MKINEFKQNGTTRTRSARFSPKFPSPTPTSKIFEASKTWGLGGKKFSLVNDKGTYILVTQGTGKEQKLKAKTPQDATQELVKRGYLEEKPNGKNSPIAAADRVIAKRDKIMGKPKDDERYRVFPEPDGSNYQKGDLVVINGRSYILDEYEDGIWWATDDDGGNIEFRPGTEDHHEPMDEDSPDNEDWDNDVTKTLRKIVDEHQAQKVKFDNGKKTTVDAFTASAVIQGLEAMRPDLQVKAADFINKSPGHLVKFSEMVFGSQKEGYGESVDPVGLSLNVMREAFAEYEKDSTVRWDKYANYRGLRQKMAHVANRIEEGQMKQLSMDLDDKEMSDKDFKKKYNSSRADMKKSAVGPAPV